jgi:uracil DNA glycosylase
MGDKAKQIIKEYTVKKHTVIEVSHPGKDAYNRTKFFGSNCLNTINKELLKLGEKEINWIEI